METVVGVNGGHLLLDLLVAVMCQSLISNKHQNRRRSRVSGKKNKHKEEEKASLRGGVLMEAKKSYL